MSSVSPSPDATASPDAATATPDSVTDSVTDSAIDSAAEKAGQSAWQVFASTFVTIFLAELGDKTQVTTLLMSAESHKPWIVFAGAGSALVATSLLGVLLGRWLATRLSPRTLERSAGITLLVITAGLVWDIYSGL